MRKAKKKDDRIKQEHLNDAPAVYEYQTWCVDFEAIQKGKPIKNLIKIVARWCPTCGRQLPKREA